MTVYKEFRVGGGSNPFGFLGPLIILALIFAALFFIAKGVFSLLAWAAPVLLIVTLFIDYTVFVDFFKFIWKLLRENTLFGILALVLIFFGFPIVSGYLFFKSIMRRTIKKSVEQIEKSKNTYTEYEEVEDEPFLELPPIQKAPEKQKEARTNDYDDMFK
ncbi:MAG: hypothetical protein IPM42_07110 [Saprospiraceae bacterium]|nr:hypothetical protein [Saprospiraceae bacterium]